MDAASEKNFGIPMPCIQENSRQAGESGWLGVGAVKVPYQAELRRSTTGLGPRRCEGMRGNAMLPDAVNSDRRQATF